MFGEARTTGIPALILYKYSEISRGRSEAAMRWPSALHSLLNGQALTCCHLGNCCQGNVPGGLTDLSWQCATGLQQVWDSEGPLATNSAVLCEPRTTSIG
ncbi:unnamed protein product [Leuciscus chuanchicus]